MHMSTYPLAIGGVALDHAAEEGVGHGSAAHGCTGMTAVGLLHRVHGQAANRAHAERVQLVESSGGGHGDGRTDGYSWVQRSVE